MYLQSIYLDYATDRACISYARSLAALLQAKLVVGYAPPSGRRMTNEDAETVSIRIHNDPALKEMRDPDQSLSVWVAQRGDTEVPDEGAIIVSNSLENHPRFPVWRPSAETTVRNTTAPVLIPFGNKPEFEYGYLWGVALACRIDVPAIFYHTTWPRDGVVSACGRDHWHAGAEEVARRAEEYAREMGVASEIVVERAANVREGVHQMALYRRALCIVAQQDRNVIAGGYHDELMRYGHLAPLVILPKGGK